MTEIYKPINHFPGYEVSNYGNIRHGNRVLKSFKVAKKYLGIHLMRNGVRFNLRINRLVAEHFIGIPQGKDPDDLIVNHKDLDKSNNYVDNLEWLTASENTQHALKFYLNFHDKSKMARIRKKLKAEGVNGIKVRRRDSCCDFA